MRSFNFVIYFITLTISLNGYSSHLTSNRDGKPIYLSKRQLKKSNKHINNQVLNNLFKDFENLKLNKVESSYILKQILNEKGIFHKDCNQKLTSKKYKCIKKQLKHVLNTARVSKYLDDVSYKILSKSISPFVESLKTKSDEELEHVQIRNSKRKIRLAKKRISLKHLEQAFKIIKKETFTSKTAVSFLSLLSQHHQVFTKKCEYKIKSFQKKCLIKNYNSSLILANELSYTSYSNIVHLYNQLPYFVSNIQNSTISLKKYALSLMVVNNLRKNKLLEFNLKDEPHPFLNNRKFKRKVIGLKKDTATQRLYLNFSIKQILLMSNLVEEMINVMNSAVGILQFDYQGDGKFDKSIELSFTEKYRAGIKIFLREYERLINGPKFKGNKPLLIDLLTASLETGVISNDHFKTMLKVSQLGLIKKSFWQRHKQVIKGLLKTGVSFIPVVGPFLIIPMIITEAIIEGRNGYQKPSADHLF